MLPPSPQITVAQTIYTDADSLTVGIVTVAPMTVSGITTSDDDVTLTVLANDLRIEQAVNLGTSDLAIGCDWGRDPDGTLGLLQRVAWDW